MLFARAPRSPTHRRRFGGISIALMSMMQCGGAEAADWYTGATPAKPDESWIVAVDTSASTTSTGSSFAAISATLAPGSLDKSGARVRATGLAGTYTFDSAGSGLRTRGDQVEGALLAGYQLVSGQSSYSFYGGLDVRDSRFSNTDPGHAPNGTQFGFKGVAEFYVAPSEQTMLAGYGSYSTNYDAYYTRVRWGVAAAAGVYVGPEFSALGDDFYRQWRIGAHLTGIKFSGVQFGVSAGYLVDKVGRSGGYGTLDARVVY